MKHRCCLRNVGGKFSDVSAKAGAPFLTAMAGRGAAFGDLNNDGAVDVVVSDIGGAPRVFRNGAAENGWLLIDTIGTKSNRDGIGASMRIVMASGASSLASFPPRGAICRRMTSAYISDWGAIGR